MDNTIELKKQIIDKYNQVLYKGARWEIGYWYGSLGLFRANICIDYLINTILDTPNNNQVLTKYILNKYKLSTMLQRVFNGDISLIHATLTSNTHNNEIKEIKNKICNLTKNDFLNKPLIKNLLNQILELLEDEQKILKLEYEFLTNTGLYLILKESYNGDVFTMIEDIRPGKFKDWQYEPCEVSKQTYYIKNYQYSSSHFEEKCNREEVFHWLVKTKLDNNYNNLHKLSKELLSPNLKNLLTYYNGSMFGFVDEFAKGSTTPITFNEYHNFKYWENHKELGRKEIFKFLEKQNIDKSKILSLRIRSFGTLRTVFCASYDDFIYNLIDDLYPGEFKDFKWFVNDIPKYLFEKKENRIEAVLSIIKKLDLSKTDILEGKLSKETFKEFKLEYIFEEFYKCNIYKLMNDISPCEYSKKDFKDTASTYEYLDLFEKTDYKKIDINKLKKENPILLDKKINDIFSKNTNFWNNSQQDLNKTGFHNLHEHFINLVENDYMSIYEFEYKEPNEPENAVENRMYSFLYNHSKSSNENVVWNYWRAFKFFENYDIRLSYQKVFMTLSVQEVDYEPYLFEKLPTNTKTLFNKKVLNNYNSTVRCGSLECCRLLSELNQNDFFWIFPFKEVSQTLTKNVCYLITIDRQGAQYLSEKTSSEFEKYLNPIIKSSHYI